MGEFTLGNVLTLIGLVVGLATVIASTRQQGNDTRKMLSERLEKAECRQEQFAIEVKDNLKDMNARFLEMERVKEFVRSIDKRLEQLEIIAREERRRP